MSNESEQKGINVPQHKRLAQGAPINGQSQKDSGGGKSGGLSQAKKK